MVGKRRLHLGDPALELLQDFVNQVIGNFRHMGNITELFYCEQVIHPYGAQWDCAGVDNLLIILDFSS